MKKAGRDVFSTRLKELREWAGLSQNALAGVLLVAQSTVGGWEAGKREPSLDMIIQLADLFCVSTDYLLGRTDNKNTYIAKMPPDLEGMKVEKIGSPELTSEEVEGLRQLLEEHNKRKKR